jgi:hypothetical protein
MKFILRILCWKLTIVWDILHVWVQSSIQKVPGSIPTVATNIKIKK